MFNPLPVIKAELKRSIAGSVAIIILIAIATALTVGITSQERALRKGSTHAAHDFDIIIGAPGNPTQLLLSTVYLQLSSMKLMPGRVLQELQKDKGVDFAAPIAFGDHYRDHLIIGATRDLATLGSKRNVREGRCFQSRFEAVIGADVRLAIGEQFIPVHGHNAEHNHIKEKGEHNEHEGTEYVIVGRMQKLGTPWDRAILVPVESIWDIHGLYHSRDEKIGPPWDGEIPGVPAIVVKPKTFSDAYSIRSRYNTKDTIAIFPADVLLKLYDLLGDIRNVVTAMSIVTQTLVLTSIVLIIFIMLNYRQKQIAVLRALGATQGYIFFTVWLYTTILVVAGTGFGLIGGWLTAHIFTKLFSAKTGLHLPVVITYRELILTISIIILGMLIAFIPAWMAYRRPVAENLKMQ